MAETSIWNISSTDDPELHYVTRNDPDDGNYIFTPPESGQITYKITYTNGSATGETIYVVKSTDCYVDPCQNNLTGPAVTFTSPEGATAKTVGSAADSVNVTYDLGECWKFISASRYGEPNNITSFRDSDGKIIYYAANKTTDKLQSDAIYKFRNYAANVIVSSYVRIIQESKCASEPAPTLNPLSITDVPIEGETYSNKIEFDVTECWYLKSAVTGENWVNLSDNYHTVVVSRNDTPSERSTDIVYTFENTEDSTKTTAYTVNVKQIANACANTPDPSINPNEYTVASVGSQEDRSATWRPIFNRACWTLINVTDNDSCIENITFNQESVSVRLKENSEGQIMTSVHNVFKKYDGTEKDIQVIITQIPDCTCNYAFNYYPESELRPDILGTAIFGLFTVAKAGCDVDIDETTGNIKAIVDSDAEGILSDGKLHVDDGERGSYVVKGYITPNRTTYNKTLTYHLRFMDTNCDTQSITQPFGCTCDSGINYYPVTEPLPSEATNNVLFGNFTTNASCDIDITEGTGNLSVVIDSDPGGIVTGGLHISTNHGAYIVTGNVTSNIISEKTIKYHLKLDDTSCDQQTATQPVGCLCSDIDVIFEGDGAHKFDLNQQDNVMLCKLQVNSSCVNVSNDMFDYNTSHFTQIRIGNKIRTSPDIYNVMADLPGLNNAESTSFSIKVGNNTCGPFMIYRTCFCGTDNCKVVFPDGSIETYPLHVDSIGGTYSHTSFGDKVYIPVDVLMDRDGNSVPATGTGVPDAYEVYTTDNNGQTWCKVYYYVQDNIGYLHYICEDNTGPQRKATFTFKVPDNTILRSDVGAPERWVGKTCCSPFTVELMQASVGHRFAKDGVCRKSGFSNYIEVDLNDPRENHNDLVDCHD